MCLEKKQIEIKPKTPIATETYFSSAQQTSQEIMFSKQYSSSSKQSAIQKTSSSRPSSTHVDKFTERSKQSEKGLAEPTQGPIQTGQAKPLLSTPTRSASIEVTQDTQIMRVIIYYILVLYI